MAPLNKSLKHKNAIPKMTTQTLLDFDLDEESSSDSDFRIEDHDESDDDFSEKEVDSGKEDDTEDDDDDSESDDDSKSDNGFAIKNILAANNKSNIEKNSGNNIKDLLNKAAATATGTAIIPTHPICCACLGDRSDDANEIIECDGCGVSVHEGCYGVSDTNSISSTNSSCSTEPWFCEACRAGIKNPSCELCPNKGGIFKETDVGKWVHLVCALYVPGVAFGEVDQLSSVTLFEMPYSKWGAKLCSLCVDERFARTGVCIGCDAGMCKSYFHVTCAQATGFLSEAHSEEVDHADPFYAHCKVHSDKTMIKHRKRNYNTLNLRMEQKKLLTKKETTDNEKSINDQQRIQRKLVKHQTKYRANKTLKNEPWVPTQKISRLLTTSATAVNRLLLKADCMGIDTEALEFQEAQMAALADVKKKWHIPPAFSVEFIGYYLDRITRLKELKSNLETYIENHTSLSAEQKRLREEYDQKITSHADLLVENNKLKDSITNLHKQMSTLCPNKPLPTIENIGRPVIPIENNQQPPTPPPARPISVPTAAALKMGVGFPLTNLPGGIKDDTGRILSTQRENKDELVHDCGICKRCNDQHLLAKCDTCHFYYHLGCLHPPLSRHPKKSKLYGWQCSECDKSDDSDAVVDMPKGPRKSRTRFSKDGTIVPVDPSLSSSNADGNSSTKSEFSPAKRKLSIEKLHNILPPVQQLQPQIYRPPPQQQIELNKDEMVNPIISISPQSLCNGGKIITPKEFGSSPKKPYVKISKNININNTIAHARNLFHNCGEKTNDIVGQHQQQNASVTEESMPVAIIDLIDSSPELPNKKQKDKLFELPPINEGTLVNKKSSLSLTGDIHPHAHPPVKSKQKDKSIKKEKRERKNCMKKSSILALSESQQPIESNCSLITVNAFPAETRTTPSIIAENITAKVADDQQQQQQQHKQNRKRRKDKHKSKYSSDADKSPNKEHKKKRKKKNHDMENPNDSVSISSVPKIKIRFKTLPLPGEAAPEPQFFYVSADMVRPMDISRPTSVETVDDSTVNNDDVVPMSSSINEDKLIPSENSIEMNSIATTPNRKKMKKSTPKTPTTSTVNFNATTSKISTIITSPASQLSSPRRSTNKRRSTNSNNSLILSANNSLSQGNGCCDVCHEKGTNQKTVQCDECHKIYHFTCLDPPLKKTPKRRGYSWHCADCDPTDIEGT